MNDNEQPSWLLLITNLPGQNQTLRMRVWRALKAAGARLLRDGVYVLPQTAACRKIFDHQAAEIRAAAGSVHILKFESDSTEQHKALLSCSIAPPITKSSILALTLAERRSQKSANLMLEEPSRRSRATSRPRRRPTSFRENPKVKCKVRSRMPRQRSTPDSHPTSRGHRIARFPGATPRTISVEPGQRERHMDRPSLLRLAHPPLHRSEGEVRLARTCRGQAKAGNRL